MSLVLTNGITLARRRGDAISFGEDISQSQLMAEQQDQARRGTYIGPGGLDGQLRVFSYRTMRDYPVIVTVGTLERDAFAAVERGRDLLRRRLRCSPLLVALACTVGILLLARNERASRRCASRRRCSTRRRTRSWSPISSAG